MLSFLIYITIFSTLLLIKAIIEDNEGLIGGSICLLVLTIFFGWVIAGNVAPINYTFIKQTPIEIIKGKHIAIILTDRKKLLIENYDLDKINKNTTYYYKVSYNMYDKVIDTNLIIK